MLKAVGSCIVILTAAYIGLIMRNVLARRVAVLRGFRMALELMERELRYSGMDMPALLELLSARIEPPADTFFRRCGAELARLDEGGFGGLWRRTLIQSDFPLREEECKVLEYLGDVLGRYDGEGQCGAICRARLELTERQKRAEEERKTLSRLYQTISVGAGVLAVILLL